MGSAPDLAGVEPVGPPAFCHPGVGRNGRRRLSAFPARTTQEKHRGAGGSRLQGHVRVTKKRNRLTQGAAEPPAQRETPCLTLPRTSHTCFLSSLL